MKTSQYIKLFVALVGITVITFGILSLLAIDRSHYFRERAEAVSAQLLELVDLSRSTSHLSEHVAEHFTYKLPTAGDINHSREDIENTLKNLRRVTEAEIKGLRTREEVEVERDDTIRIERIEALKTRAFDLIDRALLLENQGKTGEAVALLDAEFNKKIMVQFDLELAKGIRDERSELLEADTNADAFRSWLISFVIVLTALFAGLVLLLAYFLLGRLAQPIAALTAGADLFSQGKFDHRIDLKTQDEFGLLARRFNAMAESLEKDQASQVETQRELERKVEERTIDLKLKAEELDTSNARLDQINKRRTQFLADISHEVRTPLTILRGEAELVLRMQSKTAKPYRDALSKILCVSGTISKLVDDLLFLARSESDTIRFETRSVDLANIARAALDDAAFLAKTKDITLRPMFDEKSTLKVEGDPVRIQQALLIALDNAIKYSPPNKNVDFILKAYGTHAEIAVRDFGEGVADEDLPYVFERFYRAKNEEGLPGGFGLGLSIAKWIVDKHGGDISIQSLPDSYTELKLTLPLLSAASGTG